MVKTTLWTVGLSLAVVTTISCKKKSEDPVPEDLETPSTESPEIFRPSKVYMGTDSSDLKLSAEYAYNEEGRIKQSVFFSQREFTTPY